MRNKILSGDYITRKKNMIYFYRNESSNLPYKITTFLDEKDAREEMVRLVAKKRGRPIEKTRKPATTHKGAIIIYIPC